MSTTTIIFRFQVNDALADATSVVLRDPTNTYGVKRTDTGAKVVDPGTPMARQSVGVYVYSFTDPATGLTYNYWVQAVHNGITYEFEKNLSGPPSLASRTYLPTSEADAIAALLPSAQLSGYNAAIAADKAKALEAATADVDAAMVYQGRRYDTSGAQVLEFPRVAYETRPAAPGPQFGARGVADVIWDWDESLQEAVVPSDVKRAVVYQANWLILGRGQGRLDAQHEGVAYDQSGGMAESYKQDHSTAGQGALTGLCRPAYLLMRKYRIKGGQIV